MAITRPKTTLFLLQSLDGKLSLDDSFEHDFELEFVKDPLLKVGLNRYYNLELSTSDWSLTTGKTQCKMYELFGSDPIKRVPVTTIIVDSTHLTKDVLRWLLKKFRRVIIVTSNENHVGLRVSGVEVLSYEGEHFGPVFEFLYEMGCRELTIQSGGMLNGSLISQGLVDMLKLVVAPVIIGNDNAPSIARTMPSLSKFKLTETKNSTDSFLYLTYSFRE